MVGLGMGGREAGAGSKKTPGGRIGSRAKPLFERRKGFSLPYSPPARVRSAIQPAMASSAFGAMVASIWPYSLGRPVSAG